MMDILEEDIQRAFANCELSITPIKYDDKLLISLNFNGLASFSRCFLPDEQELLYQKLQKFLSTLSVKEDDDKIPPSSNPQIEAEKYDHNMEGNNVVEPGTMESEKSPSYSRSDRSQSPASQPGTDEIVQIDSVARKQQLHSAIMNVLASTSSDAGSLKYDSPYEEDEQTVSNNNLIEKKKPRSRTNSSRSNGLIVVNDVCPTSSTDNDIATNRERKRTISKSSASNEIADDRESIKRRSPVTELICTEQDDSFESDRQGSSKTMDHSDPIDGGSIKSPTSASTDDLHSPNKPRRLRISVGGENLVDRNVENGEMMSPNRATQINDRTAAYVNSTTIASDSGSIESPPYISCARARGVDIYPELSEYSNEDRELMDFDDDNDDLEDDDDDNININVDMTEEDGGSMEDGMTPRGPKIYSSFTPEYEDVVLVRSTVENPPFEFPKDGNEVLERHAKNVETFKAIRGYDGTCECPRYRSVKAYAGIDPNNPSTIQVFRVGKPSQDYSIVDEEESDLNLPNIGMNWKLLQYGQTVWAKWQSVYWPAVVVRFLDNPSQKESIDLSKSADKRSKQGKNPSQLTVKVQWYDGKTSKIIYEDVDHFELYFHLRYEPKRMDTAYCDSVALAIFQTASSGYYQELVNMKVAESVKTNYGIMFIDFPEKVLEELATGSKINSKSSSKPTKKPKSAAEAAELKESEGYLEAIQLMHYVAFLQRRPIYDPISDAAKVLMRNSTSYRLKHEARLLNDISNRASPELGEEMPADELGTAVRVRPNDIETENGGENASSSHSKLESVQRSEIDNQGDAVDSDNDDSSPLHSSSKKRGRKSRTPAKKRKFC